jgi:hypothetical protein
LASRDVTLIRDCWNRLDDKVRVRHLLAVARASAGDPTVLGRRTPLWVRAAREPARGRGGVTAGVLPLELTAG